jgi:hypothetical protein
MPTRLTSLLAICVLALGACAAEGDDGRADPIDLGDGEGKADGDIDFVSFVLEDDGATCQPITFRCRETWSCDANLWIRPSDSELKMLGRRYFAAMPGQSRTELVLADVVMYLSDDLVATSTVRATLIRDPRQPGGVRVELPSDDDGELEVTIYGHHPRPRAAGQVEVTKRELPAFYGWHTGSFTAWGEYW